MNIQTKSPAANASEAQNQTLGRVSDHKLDKSKSAQKQMSRAEKRAALTQERLHELVTYDPATGDFHARVDRGKFKGGDKLGKSDGRYVSISIDGISYYAHRLVWLYIHGHWPNPCGDHLNGNGLDNRLSNLREASLTQNNWNKSAESKNSSGRTGIYLEQGRWKARIGIANRWLTLGSFKTFSEALAVREAAEIELTGSKLRGAA